jgi:hypothetical protein
MTVWLRCGHGTIEEEVIFWPESPTKPLVGTVEDSRIIRMTLAHHAYMCACDCIRPLWRKYFDEVLTTQSAEEALWFAMYLMNTKGYVIRTCFYPPKGPRAPRWVVEPEETWDESQEYWPEEDE